MTLFSPLTSQIFGGLLLAGVIYHTVDEIGDARALNKAEAEINEKQKTINTLRGNVGTLEEGLATCNQGVADTAALAQRMAELGRAAVAAEKARGQREIDKLRRSIMSAPAETCEDAEAILRGEAG